MSRLSDIRTLVTGGTSGIGTEIVHRLVSEGAPVVFTGRDGRRGGKVARETGATFVRADATNADAVRRSVREAVGTLGGLDAVVLNAGVLHEGALSETPDDVWDAVLETNLVAPYRYLLACLPELRQAGGGSIVAAASDAGLLPRAHDPVYSISKMALVGLTKSLALSHGPDRIRVNAVCPGPVGDTNIMNDDLAGEDDPESASQRYIAASPLAAAHGRMISPQEVAESILYLVSDAASMVTGTMIAIDGGKSLGVPPKWPSAPRSSVFEQAPPVP